MINIDVSIVIPTIGGREDMLLDAVKSVHHQTLQPRDLLVARDNKRRGTAATINPLIERCATGWYCRLDDDDVLLPHHLETVWRHATRADVVYTDCQGGPAHVNQPFDPDLLRERNYIPATALVRTQAARDVGLPTCYAEDWALWLRLLNAGATFLHIPEVTWHYRQHDGWRKTPNRPPGTVAEAKQDGGL